MAETINDRITRQKEEAERRKKAQEEAAGSLPASPLAMSGLGSTPDQAKMAGVQSGSSIANQLGSPAPVGEPTTLEQTATQQQQMANVAQDQTLQTELGEKTFEDEDKDAAQQKAAEFSQKMQSFGSLGGRVEALVKDAFSGKKDDGTLKSIAKGTNFDITVSDDILADGVSSEDMKDVLTKFQNVVRSDPDSAFQVLVDNKDKFKNQSSTMMKFIGEAYKNDPATLNQVTAKLIASDAIDPDEVNLSSLMSSGLITMDENGNIAELGISESDLVEILGNDWKKLTPAQIGEEVENTQQEILANQEKIEDQLADPNLPPQTRIALLDELKRMGAIGATQYEQRAAEATEVAQNVGKIFIDGKVQDINELLKDANIQENVINYLSDPDSEANKKWAKMNPEFADWMNREVETLGLSATALDKKIGDIEENVASSNKKLETNLVDEGGVLGSDIMEALGFKGGFEAAGNDFEGNPIYTMLKDIPDTTTTADAVSVINALPKNQLAQLKDLDPTKLRDILTNKEKAHEFLALAEMKDKWAQITPEDGPDAMIDTIMGNKMGGSEGVKKKMADLFMAVKIGNNPQAAAEYELMRSLFDSDGNGQVDDPVTVKANVDKFINVEGDISNLVEGGMSGRIAQIRNMDPNTTGSGGLHDQLKNYMGAGDTTIDHADLEDLSGKIDIHTLGQFKSPDLASLGIDPAKIDSLIRDKAKTNVNNLMSTNALGLNLDSFNSTDSLNNPQHVGAFKETRTVLEKLAVEGHPAEKEMAKQKLREIAGKTVKPDLNITGPQFSRSFGHVSGYRVPNPPSGPIGQFFVQQPDGSYAFDTQTAVTTDKELAHDMIRRWATWRNYAKDENNMGEFFEALENK
jgi:hypothetical protein